MACRNTVSSASETRPQVQWTDDDVLDVLMATTTEPDELLPQLDPADWWFCAPRWRAAPRKSRCRGHCESAVRVGFAHRITGWLFAALRWIRGTLASGRLLSAGHAFSTNNTKSV